jgi:hypothetical protein
MADSLWIVATDRFTPLNAPPARTLAERVVFPLLYSMPIAPHCDSIVAGPVVTTAVPEHAESIDRYAVSSQPFVVDSLDVGEIREPRTGPYEIAAATDTALDLLPRQPSTGPSVHFSAIDDGRGRDAIDAGADIVFTSDARTIAYAAAQSDRTSIPLMWDRVYVLIEPTPRNHGDLDSVVAVQRDLATNTLKVEARPATDSVRGGEVLPCPMVEDDFTSTPAPAPSTTGQTPGPRIVYEKDDGVARAISERLVALADARSHRLAALEGVLSAAGPARANGLERAAFRQALRDGNEAAYVTAVPFDIGERCSTVNELAFAAPWLLPRSNNPVESHIAPLVETRARALVRRGRVGLALDGVGNVYLLFGSRPTS